MAGNYIIGAGITGLAAGVASGWPVLEAATRPGGLCASYQMDGYRFERGAGHWIFGLDIQSKRFLEKFCSLRRYERRAATMIDGQLITHPFQYHLYQLGPELAGKALLEVNPEATGDTMQDWLLARFGPTLHQLFFSPFNERYTAGLYNRIAPPEGYKTPLDRRLVVAGALGSIATNGYNAEFYYPACGLGELTRRIASTCDVQYGAQVVGVNENQLCLADGRYLEYDSLISTVPLASMAGLAGLEEFDPASIIHVANIGAEPGRHWPQKHWIYVADSECGFHRLQMYSNVDAEFAPVGKVSFCVETAHLNIVKEPGLTERIIAELQSWGWIGEVDVWDSVWINPAYSWRWPGSTWVQETMNALARMNIYQIGSLGRWKFQGIADSLRDGFLAGATLR